MKKWVYPITKVPSDFPYSNAFELLQYYRKEKRLSSETNLWKCNCCQEEKSNMVATFVVSVHGLNKNLYLTFIFLDCLKEQIANQDNPTFFQVYDEDLLFISKYNSSSGFIDISIKEP